MDQKLKLSVIYSYWYSQKSIPNLHWINVTSLTVPLCLPSDESCLPPRGCHLEDLLGYSFIIRGKVGRGKRPSLSFLNGRHASIISSSSRLGRGVFLSLHGKARSTNYCLLLICAQRARLDLLSSLSRMWVSHHHCFIVWGLAYAPIALSCCQTSLLGFVAKQTCFPE